MILVYNGLFFEKILLIKSLSFIINSLKNNKIFLIN